jgi:hypothetical protein
MAFIFPIQGHTGGLGSIGRPYTGIIGGVGISGAKTAIITVGSITALNNIVIGKRIPVGAAINGLINFSAYMWNVAHFGQPEMQLDILAVGTISVTLTAIAQILIVNFCGVTQPKG